MTKFIDTNLNNFQLPQVVSSDVDYYIELDKYFNNYIRHIKNISGIDSTCVTTIENNIKLILESLELYNNAKVGDAKECIKKIVKQYCNAPYIVANIDKNYAFRGMAPEEIQPQAYKGDSIYLKMNKHPLSFFKGRVAVETIKRRDMLHIPFDKRGLIMTQRFSIAGVPCLYLSTTSLGCWLELNMPQLDLFQVSSYKIPSDLKILNMCISQYTINGSSGGGWVDDEGYKNVCSLLELFPLVCATSFQVLDMNRNFKSEYIISQLLMEVINELGIDGIAYLSKKMEDYYAYPQLVNLAILMNSDKLPPYSDDGYDMYWERSNEIYLTNAFKSLDIPLSFNSTPFKSYVNEIYKDDNNNTVILVGNKVSYTDTIFSRLDEFLVSKEHYKFK